MIKISALALLYASSSQASVHDTAVTTVEPVTPISRIETGAPVAFRDLNSECRFYGNVREIGDTTIRGNRIQFFDVSVTKQLCGNKVSSVSLRSSHFEMPPPADYQFKLFKESEESQKSKHGKPEF